MGTFQSKHKYDVATGELTIKGKGSQTRSDRKKEQPSRVIQHNDMLNKLSAQQSSSEQNESGVYPKQNTEWGHFSETNEDVVFDQTKLVAENEPNEHKEPVNELKDAEEAVLSNDEAKHQPKEQNLEEKPSCNESEAEQEAAQDSPKPSGEELSKNEVIQEDHEDLEPIEPLPKLQEVKEQNNTKSNLDPHVSQIFIDEEIKVASVPLTSPSDENEQEAITVLNDVIKEVVSNIPEACPINKTDVDTESAISQDSSTHVLQASDSSDLQEISDTVNVKPESIKEPDDDSSTVAIVKTSVEMHEITVSEPEHVENNEKVPSHVCLESVNNDEIHYTLDKLQIMEEQIKSDKARILSIKEIN